MIELRPLSKKERRRADRFIIYGTLLVRVFRLSRVSMLKELKRRGAGPVDAIKTLRHIDGLSLGEANEAMSDTGVWDFSRRK